MLIQMPRTVAGATNGQREHMPLMELLRCPASEGKLDSATHVHSTAQLLSSILVTAVADLARWVGTASHPCLQNRIRYHCYLQNWPSMFAVLLHRAL